MIAWADLRAACKQESDMCGPSFFFACVSINDFSYVKGNEKYSLYKRKLLASPRLPNVELEQYKTYVKNDLVDPSWIALVAKRKFSFLGVLYASYWKTEFASPVQLEYS